MAFTNGADKCEKMRVEAARRAKALALSRRGFARRLVLFFHLAFWRLLTCESVAECQVTSLKPPCFDRFEFFFVRVCVEIHL